MVSENLKEYIKNNIEPIYSNFYAHGKKHIENVIAQSFIIAKDFEVNYDMIYTIACFHDLGLLINREEHEKESGRILYENKELKNYFTTEEIITMKEAVEDHRGSRKIEPRNIYGKIISDADRDIYLEVLAVRQLPTSIKNYPELIGFEEHFERCYQYFKQRCKDNFKVNLWLENKVMRKQLDKLASDYSNKEETKKVYDKAWRFYKDNDLIEKIKNSPYE